jgi:hypothetical protein
MCSLLFGKAFFFGHLPQWQQTAPTRTPSMTPAYAHQPNDSGRMTRNSSTSVKYVAKATPLVFLAWFSWV